MIEHIGEASFVLNKIVYALSQLFKICIVLSFLFEKDMILY